MNGQENIQKLLNEKFTEMRLKNSSYSMRAFARKLGLQPSAVHEILKGKRRISHKIATIIADKLLLDPTERANLLREFPQKLSKKSKFKEGKSEELNRVKLSTQQFELIADWSHYAILNLLETKNVKTDVPSMAKRLCLSEKRIKESLRNLFELNLITLEDGVLKRTFAKVNSTDDVKNLSLQLLHSNDMEMAKEKMQTVDVKFRDFTSFTLPFDLRLMPKVKEMIRKFQDDLVDLMEEEQPQEVYKLNTYLYPLTQIESEPENVQ